jgi:DNA polymerase I-like protein with 3'-5' exonuclease and polymerase domains
MKFFFVVCVHTSLSTRTRSSFRKCFVPRSADWVIISADYSQIELRVIAHLSGDEALIGLLNKERGDVFRAIAGVVYGKLSSETSDAERKIMKGIVYGIVYGMGSGAIAEKLCVSKEDAESVMKLFYHRYPAIGKWKEDVGRQCIQQQGFVETLGGRRRYFGVTHQKKAQKAALRQSINTLCQGSTADIMRSAMIKIAERLQPHEARMVLQIHDEFLLECRASCRLRVENVVERCMIEAWTLRVPLRVRIMSGPSWGELTNKDSQ